MKITSEKNNYSINNMTLDEFTAVIVALGDYVEKRGTDTTGFELLNGIANAAEQEGKESLARNIRSLLPTE